MSCRFVLHNNQSIYYRITDLVVQASFLNLDFKYAIVCVSLIPSSHQSAGRSWSCWGRIRSTTTRDRSPSSAKTASTRSSHPSRRPRLSRASSTLTIQVGWGSSPNPLPLSGPVMTVGLLICLCLRRSVITVGRCVGGVGKSLWQDHLGNE